MLFCDTKIAGVFRIVLERREDDRGYFARTWSREDFARRGLVAQYVESSVSYNARARTLRGMHYQAAPRAETKIVTCLRGAIYDVAVDLRPDSPTYLQWAAATLSGDTLEMLYIPEGCAHGFLTLTRKRSFTIRLRRFIRRSTRRGFAGTTPRSASSGPPHPTSFRSATPGIRTSVRGRAFARFPGDATARERRRRPSLAAELRPAPLLARAARKDAVPEARVIVPPPPMREAPCTLATPK